MLVVKVLNWLFKWSIREKLLCNAFIYVIFCKGKNKVIFEWIKCYLAW